MTLQIPNYIAKAQLATAPLNFKWDDATSDEVYITPDEKLRRRIKLTSKRGVIALSLGFSEWIAWRFGKDDSSLTLLNMIEACWASLVDWRYLSKHAPVLDWDEWKGPVRGPLCAASKLISDVVRLTRTKQFASPEAVCISRLALYVLPKPEAFKEWRKFAISRLAETDPNREEDRLGRPIPREALDPDFDYKPDQANELLLRFLQSLDYTSNPYLASPESIRNMGFEGTPYSQL